jgi:hypothetical protein
MDLRFGYPAVVDEVSVRLVAAVVLVIATVAAVGGLWWLYAALALDFVLRAAYGPRRSPIAQLVVRWLRPRVALPSRPTAGPPKRFAAGIGAGCTLSAAMAGAIAANSPSGSAPVATAILLAIGVVMVVFPALEAFAGRCVGCLIFARLIRWGAVSESTCLECADLTRRAAAAAQA